MVPQPILQQVCICFYLLVGVHLCSSVLDNTTSSHPAHPPFNSKPTLNTGAPRHLEASQDPTPTSNGPLDGGKSEPPNLGLKGIMIAYGSKVFSGEATALLQQHQLTSKPVHRLIVKANSSDSAQGVNLLLNAKMARSTSTDSSVLWLPSIEAANRSACLNSRSVAAARVEHLLLK